MLMKKIMPAFESERVLSRNVDTQLLSGVFKPDTGRIVDFKRPGDFRSVRSPKGDISGVAKNRILAGKASGIVQDYITVPLEWDNIEEALELDQMDELVVQPAASRLVTDLEVDFADFMMKNSGLLSGNPGTAVTTWEHVADSSAVMKSTGIPSGKWNYSVNPFTQVSLASKQKSLGSGGISGDLISQAHKEAIIDPNFAGMKVMTATTLSSFTSATTGDLVGSLSATPAGDYVTAKDTMTQTLAVTGFGSFAGTIPAGTVIRITGRNRLNLNTRTTQLGATGSKIEHTAVVTTTSAAFSSGAGTLVVSGPGLNETDGQYNTVDSALTSGDIVTILNADNTLFQPNLFWHEKAFSIGSVPIPRLNATDAFAQTKDGLQIRLTGYSLGDENEQRLRLDFLPAYAVINPFFAGQAFGS